MLEGAGQLARPFGLAKSADLINSSNRSGKIARGHRGSEDAGSSFRGDRQGCARGPFANLVESVRLAADAFLRVLRGPALPKMTPSVD